MPAILDHTTLTDGSDADAVYTAFVEWAESTGISPVSYTHLTLPTNREV